MKIDIKHRNTGGVIFNADVNCDENKPMSIKLGLAVEIAIKKKADLSGADLCGANLIGADFYEANLNGANLLILQTDIWTCYIEPGTIRIGCEYHKSQDWFNFDDRRISKMDKRALDWWKKYKPAIVTLWETLPKEGE